MKQSLIFRLLMAIVAVVLLAGHLRAYVFGGQKWPSNTVNYYVNTTNGFGLSAQGILTDLQAGADAWSIQAHEPVTFHYAGSTAATGFVQDGQNTVSFNNAASPYGYMGETHLWWNGSNQLTEFDMVWWGNYNYYLGGVGCVVPTKGSTARPQYLLDVATHEYGHALGMGHSTVTTATMFPTVSVWCATSERSLDPDDISGICALYNCSGSSSSKPSAPTGLTVMVPPPPGDGSHQTALLLNWTNTAMNATGISVERSQPGLKFLTVAMMTAQATTYLDQHLSNGTTYTYRVRATNSLGSSPYSNTASATAVTQ